jgi:hypothetical protein
MYWSITGMACVGQTIPALYKKCYYKWNEVDTIRFTNSIMYSKVRSLPAKMKLGKKDPMANKTACISSVQIVAMRKPK